MTGDPVNTLDPSGLYGCSPDDPGCTTGCDPSDPTSCCDPSDPSCTGQPPGSGGSGPKGPTPPAPTPVTCNSTVGSLAGALGGTAACDVGVGPNVELFTSLGDFNSFLGGLGLPQLAGTGGVISIGGVEIGWGEIAIGVLDPEVVISIAAVAGAVAIWDYYQTSRLITVQAKCSVHQNGTPNHASAGVITATGQGTTFPSAAQAAYSAAQAAVFAQYGIGFHAQHCHYTQLN